MNLLPSKQTNDYMLECYYYFPKLFTNSVSDGIVIMQLQFMWKSSRSRLWDIFLNGQTFAGKLCESKTRLLVITDLADYFS